MKAGYASFIVLALLVCGGAKAAGLPDWLLGRWMVTRVYQESPETAHYLVPGAEPAIWVGGKTMTVEADRLSLAGEVCTDLAVRAKRDTIRHLVKSRLAGEPEVFGLVPRPGWIPYLDINCGKSLTEDGNQLDDRGINYIDWIIIPDGHDKIDLMFIGYCYVELRRMEKQTS